MNSEPREHLIRLGYTLFLIANGGAFQWLKETDIQESTDRSL
jgi:hypothetical protein